MKIRVKFKDWQKIEYLAYQLQWFYVWTLNYQQDGNVTNSLESYNVYKTMDEKSVEPHFKKNDLKWLKRILNHPGRSKNTLRAKIDSVPANLSSNHKIVSIDKNEWSVIKHQIKLFLKTYSIKQATKHLLRIPQPKLQIFTRLFIKINYKNHLPNTHILDKAMAGESINSAYSKIVNNHTSLKKRGE